MFNVLFINIPHFVPNNSMQGMVTDGRSLHFFLYLHSFLTFYNPLKLFTLTHTYTHTLTHSRTHTSTLFSIAFPGILSVFESIILHSTPSFVIHTFITFTIHSFLRLFISTPLPNLCVCLSV